ncbi:outer membrane protein transport protein [Candidatus Poribacteria bacterium]|nr:outer membrane protein transport protein [Candidatus Poribacteria bacterium]
MKIQKLAAVFFLAINMLLIQQLSIHAGGYETIGLGTRAIGIGGAFIGVADDWTATYWNPAGLAALKKRSMGFTLDIVTSKGKDGNSAANPTLGSAEHLNSKQSNVFYKLPSSSESGQFNKEDVRSQSYLPGIGFNIPISIGSLGMSFYNPVGYALKWDDSVSGIDVTFRQKLYLLVLNLSLAKEITSKLSGGIGINYLQGKNEMSATKNTTQIKLDLSGEGSGYEGVAGVMYKLKDAFTIGGVYRTGSSIKVKGSGKNEGLPFAPESSDYTQKFRHPETMGIGLAYKTNPETLVALDWQRTVWSTLKRDITFDNPGTLLKNKNESYGWNSTDRWRIGTEYLLKPTTTLRAGFTLDPLVPEKDTLNITNVVSVGKKVASMGIGYKPDEIWNFDFLYLYAWGEEKYNDTKFTQNVNSFQMALGYNF